MCVFVVFLRRLVDRSKSAMEIRLLINDDDGGMVNGVWVVVVVVGGVL